MYTFEWVIDRGSILISNVFIDWWNDFRFPLKALFRRIASIVQHVLPLCDICSCWWSQKTSKYLDLLNKYLKHKLVTIFDLDQTNNNRMRQFNIWDSSTVRSNTKRIGTQTWISLEALRPITLSETFYWFNQRKSGNR